MTSAGGESAMGVSSRMRLPSSTVTLDGLTAIATGRAIYAGGVTVTRRSPDWSTAAVPFGRSRTAAVRDVPSPAARISTAASAPLAVMIEVRTGTTVDGG